MLSKHWQRAEPILPRDNIRLHHTYKFVFKPTYDDPKIRPDMCNLLSFEYKRMWFADVKEETRKAHRGLTQGGQVGGSGLLKRKILKRCQMKCDETRRLPIIKLKRFENVLGKVDTNLGLKHAAAD